MIQLDHLTLGYGSRVLVEDANCEMADSRLIALLGRNGSGKSSLLRVIAGLDRPLNGKAYLHGEAVDRMSPQAKARTIAFVTTQRVRIANLRCSEVVGMGRAPYTNWIGQLSEADKQIVSQSLQMVGMADYANRTMDKMSDGECQRIMIARALAQDTPIILLDEPTSFLDLPNRYELCMLLQKLAHDNGKCILFSTHELDIAVSLCDDIALIDSPHLLTGPVPDIVSSGAIHRLFSTPNLPLSPLSLI